MPEDEEMPQEKSPGESSILNPGVKIYQQESWRIFNLQSWTEDSPRRVLENLQSSILDCSQALRGIRRCHRLRSLRRGRQLSESSLSPKSPRLNAQCAFKPALRGNPCSLKEQKKCAALKGCGVSGIPQYSEVELPQWHENMLSGAWHCVLVKDKVSFVFFGVIN